MTQHDGNVLAGPQRDGVIKETSGDMFVGLDRSNSQIARRIEGDDVGAVITIRIGDVEIDVVRWEDMSGWIQVPEKHDAGDTFDIHR